LVTVWSWVKNVYGKECKCNHSAIKSRL
jgi:hypothetical protein